MRKLISVSVVLPALVLAGATLGSTSVASALAPDHAAVQSAVAPVATSEAQTLRGKGKKPKLTLSVSNPLLDQNTPLNISVASKKAKKAKIYLQRTAGTDNVFGNVLKVPKQGAVSAPGAPQGTYLVRLMAKKRGKVVAYSNTVQIFSYGPVTLAQLCERSNNTETYGCESDTVPVGGGLFAYTNVDQYGDGPDDPDSLTIKAQGSSCRSLTIEYAVSNEAADNGVTLVGGALTQEAADRQIANGVPRVINAASFVISSPSWNLNVWTEGGVRDFFNSYYVRYRGTLSCYTSTGDA